VAGRLVEPPQTRGLGDRQLQAWHFKELGPDTVDKRWGLHDFLSCVVPRTATAGSSCTLKEQDTRRSIVEFVGVSCRFPTAQVKSYEQSRPE
jgi:hypothetical protein